MYSLDIQMYEGGKKGRGTQEEEARLKEQFLRSLPAVAPPVKDTPFRVQPDGVLIASDPPFALG